MWNGKRHSKFYRILLACFCPINMMTMMRKAIATKAIICRMDDKFETAIAALAAIAFVLAIMSASSSGVNFSLITSHLFDRNMTCFCHVRKIA